MEPVQTLILLAVAANLAVMAAVVVPPLLGRRAKAFGGSRASQAGQVRLG